MKTSVERRWNDTGERKTKYLEKNKSLATSSTAIFTRNALELNQSLHGDGSATNRPSRGTTFATFDGSARTAQHTSYRLFIIRPTIAQY